MSDNPQNTAKNSPNHFIVLDAIARGLKNIDKISKATRLSREEVELIVNDLSLQRLAFREEKKKLFFGGSKLEVKVTETGLRMLNSKKQELQQQAEQLKQWNKNGNTAQLQSYMNSNNNRSWVPFMIFSGIMDILFFTSMMSFMGMALNPMESQMAADNGGGGAEADSSTESGGSEADTGGGDFGGFDGGGFGDF
ncbi:MAG TPA: MarR family transcriptional regulator [Nitrososphaeraceae archaeon]|nr:MarR family transcriptional regulator [Nitrososphaeraceae archaeon]